MTLHARGRRVVDRAAERPPPRPASCSTCSGQRPRTITPAPGIEVNGVGLRLGKISGPLIDAGLQLDSVAVHLFGSVAARHRLTACSLAGGIEIELGGLAVPLGGGGGDNAVAKGIMHDAGGSGSPPRPAFSPALAVQDHGAGVEVSLRAGQRRRAVVPADPAGVRPGLPRADRPRRRPTSRTSRRASCEMISLYLDGQVSLLGLTAAVDKLRLGYHVSRPFFAPSSWEVDVDGLRHRRRLRRR